MSKISFFLVVVILTILGFTFALRNWGFPALYMGIFVGGIVGIRGERNREKNKEKK
jgi:hypothetical protein